MESNGIFDEGCSKISCLFGILSCVLYCLGLYSVFFSPYDSLQGVHVYIMYVHVPSAWIGLTIYFIMGVFNFLFIAYNKKFYDIFSYALSHIGAVFTGLCLLTGCIWGRPIWNTLWVWDARLTSMLIMFFFYLGYILTWQHSEYGARTAAVLNLVGIVNVPIVKFSVNIWSTMHQSSSLIRAGGISIPSEMLVPLIIMTLASISLCAALWVLNVSTIMKTRKILLSVNH